MKKNSINPVRLNHKKHFNHRFKNLSKNLLIKGTNIIIQQKTTGHAIINLSHHLSKKLLFNPIFKYTMNAETNVLVQKDIIEANITNLMALFLFI